MFKSRLLETMSIERLDLLEDIEHILSLRIVGEDHRVRINHVDYNNSIYIKGSGNE